MVIQRVDSLDVAELEPYRTLRRPLEHKRKGIFVAEGEKVVRRLFQSSLSVVSVLMTPEWFDRYERAGVWSERKVSQVFLAGQKVLETIVGYRLHQGIMAVGSVPEDRSLEEAVHFGEGVIVALEGIVSAENVGVVVRNCAAFGARAILVDRTTSSPYLRRAVRNSMGAVFRLPILHLENLPPVLSTVRSRYGFRIVGTDPNARLAIQSCDMSGKICLIFGNEGSGLSRQTLDVCDETVSIPMDNDTDSLNVAVAAAIFLYEARRRSRQ